MNPDIIGAVRQMLLDDIAISDLVDNRIWAGDLDRGEVPSMPRKNIVITRGGSVPSAGSNSYIPIQRLRLDVRCYGEDAYEADVVHRSVEAFMKAIEPTTVDLTEGGVRVLNAVESVGGIALVDPDTDWPFVVSTWGVLASEILIPAEVVSS